MHSKFMFPRSFLKIPHMMKEKEDEGWVGGGGEEEEFGGVKEEEEGADRQASLSPREQFRIRNFSKDESFL